MYGRAWIGWSGVGCYFVFAYRNANGLIVCNPIEMVGFYFVFVRTVTSTDLSFAIQ